MKLSIVQVDLMYEGWAHKCANHHKAYHEYGGFTLQAGPSGDPGTLGVKEVVLKESRRSLLASKQDWLLLKTVPAAVPIHFLE